MSAKEVKEAKAGEGRRVEGPIICPGHSRPVPDLSYSKTTPDGVFLISSCKDGKPMLRDGTTGDWIGTLLGHKGAVWSARLNDDATRAVTASADYTCKLWDAITGEEKLAFDHKHIVKRAIFNKGDDKVFTGGYEKKLRIFDLNQPDSDPQLVNDFTAEISHLCKVPDSNLVLVGGGQQNIRVIDQRTLKTVKTMDTSASVVGLSVSHDEEVITAVSGREVMFYDSSSFELVKKHTLEREPNCVSYHPGAGRFVTGSDSELWVRLYDFESGKELACNKGHHGPVRCISFNPEGESYASGSEDGTIRIWEYAKNEKAAAEAAN